MKNKAIFKPYSQHQGMLFPPSLEEMIAQDHLVRVVNDLIDQLDIELLLKEYKGGGTSSFHPRMMLKVWVYGYIVRVYSCRNVAKALRENIPFMWLAGMQQPDFRTLNDFRTNRMKSVIKEVFTQVVLFCLKERYIDLSVLYTDGTMYQANANKFKAVWRKNTARYKESVLRKIDELMLDIDKENDNENKILGDKNLLETGSHRVSNSTELKEKIGRLSQEINAEQLSKNKKKVLHRTKRELAKQADKLEKYEAQEDMLGARNSYSKSDTDATMMRSKDKQLLPCYSVQNSCQNQIIVHYSIGQNPNDATQFGPHLESLPEPLIPKAILADSVYGTQINYELLESKTIESYLMYPNFHQEQKAKRKSISFIKDAFIYNPDEDTYTCPNQEKLVLIHDRTITLRNETTTQEKQYQAKNCSACPYYAKCCKGKGNRTLNVRPRYEELKEKARKNLTEEIGIQLRKQRGVEVETPFGDIKFNQGHRRMVLRGKNKVSTEVGWISLAHNIKKIKNLMKKVA